MHNWNTYILIFEFVLYWLLQNIQSSFVQLTAIKHFSFIQYSFNYDTRYCTVRKRVRLINGWQVVLHQIIKDDFTGLSYSWSKECIGRGNTCYLVLTGRTQTGSLFDLLHFGRSGNESHERLIWSYIFRPTVFAINLKPWYSRNPFLVPTNYHREVKLKQRVRGNILKSWAYMTHILFLMSVE